MSDRDETAPVAADQVSGEERTVKESLTVAAPPEPVVEDSAWVHDYCDHDGDPADTAACEIDSALGEMEQLLDGATVDDPGLWYLTFSVKRLRASWTRLCEPTRVEAEPATTPPAAPPVEQTRDQPYFARALDRVSVRLPESVDRNSPREILEFITRSSYPTAPDPLLAVAHAAVSMIQTMHDELHEIAANERRRQSSPAPVNPKAESSERDRAIAEAHAALDRYMAGDFPTEHESGQWNALCVVIAQGVVAARATEEEK